jgi:hydroxymethylglutaryl-CoA lyase
MHVAEELLKRGAQRLGIADTVGYANPKQVRDLFTELYRTVGDDVPIGAHFHDTRGLGLANVFAALDAGVREFDACLGGLGGCPYAPGASGNIVTEDLVFMLEAMGLRTGVDLDGLLETREIMKRQLKDEPVHGTFSKAGHPKGFVAAA